MRLSLVLFGKTRNRQGLGVNHVGHEEDRNQLRIENDTYGLGYLSRRCALLTCWLPIDVP
jgi:hypothetical protein